MGKRIEITHVEREAMFQRAWDWCYDNQKERDTPWVTATDIYNRVRADAHEQLHGYAYGTSGMGGGFGLGIRLSGFDIGDCRSWLARQVSRRILRADDPSGKGTCSGLRFRPASEDLTEAEKKTREDRAKAKERGPIIHLENALGKAACIIPKKTHNWGGRSARKFVRTTDDATKVTCQRCAKLPVPVCTTA